MAWDYNANEDNKDLIYDLRQTYAQILDEVLKRIAENRYNSNFPNLFSALDDLHTEINQKLTGKERKEYEGRLKECVTVLNKYPEAYNGNDKSPQNKYLVKKALKDLECWLRDMMENHRMFGNKDETEDGL